MSAAISLWTTVTVKRHPNFCIRLGTIELTYEPAFITIRGMLDELINGKINDILIEIVSDIPMNAGLGSSASLALAMTAAVYDYVTRTPLDNDRLRTTAMRIENIFHGKEGSGLDVTVSLRGGIVLYQKSMGFENLAV